MEYENKTVIVTGSARGIGREIAIKFGGLGANVVVFDIDIEGQAETAQAVCDEIKAAGGNAKYYLGDVSKPDDTDGLIKFAKDEFGSVDVIVNNAGITRDNLIMRMSEAEISELKSQIIICDEFHRVGAERASRKRLGRVFY